jgi:hypothetical protein
VGEPLLYAISVFASLGVFLVRPPFFLPVVLPLTRARQFGYDQG